MRRNADVQAGDVLILTKPLGVGIYSAVLKKGALGQQAYAEVIASMTALNSIGAELARDPAVHAITDVTGFGLLGHALAMARGSKVTLELDADDLPLLAQAADFAQRGFVTGASQRNWLSYSEEVKLPPGFPEWRQRLLTDPQTSGGLLVSCAPERAEPIEQMIIAAGYPGARTIGFAKNGKPIIRVMAS